MGAEGDGAVVTGRYLTRGAGKLVRLQLENGDELVGTAQHPIWSASRQAWTPLGELLPGEQLRGRTGPLAVLSVVPLPGTADVYNLEVHGQHVYDITHAGVLVHNAGSADGCGHYLEYELRSRRGALIKHGDEISGVDFPLQNGKRLSFPDQSWFGHTEGKVVADLWSGGYMKSGRVLTFEGLLPPCTNCQSLMKWASGAFKMTVEYLDGDGIRWLWYNGELFR